MACYYPLEAWRRGGGVVFSVPGEKYGEFQLQCGQCVGCKLERSRQWAVRCMHEKQMHESNVFVTLTYNDEHVPNDYSLMYRDFQLFMKRLRKNRLYNPIRFYMCGEYGEGFSRPHYHALLFGCFFEDRYKWRMSASGFQLWRSPTLEKLWNMGNCEIGDVTFESAAYIARYCVKSITDAGNEWIYDPETGELIEREKEFTRMSLKPGIGATWFEKYKSEVYPLDRVVIRGVEMKPPKFYDNLLKLDRGTMSDDIGFAREAKALLLTADNTPDRLRAREIVTQARLKTKVRSLK